MTFSDELIKIFDYFAEQIGIAIDWTAENVVPQLTEILGRYRLFELINEGFWPIAMLVVIIVGIKQITRVLGTRDSRIKAGVDTKYYDYYRSGPSVNGFGFAIIMLSGLGIFAGAMYISFELEDFFKWLIVPEIKYLEMLRGMMPQ